MLEYQAFLDVDIRRFQERPQKLFETGGNTLNVEFCFCQVLPNFGLVSVAASLMLPRTDRKFAKD